MLEWRVVVVWPTLEMLGKNGFEQLTTGSYEFQVVKNRETSYLWTSFVTESPASQGNSRPVRPSL